MGEEKPGHGHAQGSEGNVLNTDGFSLQMFQELTRKCHLQVQAGQLRRFLGLDENAVEVSFTILERASLTPGWSFWPH